MPSRRSAARLAEAPTRADGAEVDARVPRVDLVRASALRHFARHGYDAALAAAGPGWSARLAAAVRFHIQYVTRDEAGASISYSELRGLTGELRARHLATRDAYERKFRAPLEGGIAAGEFAQVDVPVITAGILGIGLSVGRWYRPDGRFSPDDIADEYIRFILKGLEAQSLAPATADDSAHRYGASSRSGRRRQPPVPATS